MRGIYVALLSSVLVLSGCQTTTNIKNNVFDSYQVLHNQKTNETAYISCAASISCRFQRVDDIPLMNDHQGRPTKQAIEQGVLRLEGSIFNLKNQYALSLVQGQHELDILFYPTSSQRAERFHLIHHFDAGSRYKLVMSKQKNVANGSLMQVATPGALCVDLLQDDVIKKRFCRDFDALTGLGEFVEKKL